MSDEVPSAEIPGEPSLAETVPDPLTLLARRAAESPREPWLFHRPEWTWRWRSYAVVCDQVARGAAALRDAGVNPGQGAPTVRFRDDLSPDALAASLAIRALGAQSAGGEGAVDGEMWLAPPERGEGGLELPACHNDLGPWEPESLEVPSDPVEHPLDAGLAGLLASLPEEEERPILASGPTLTVAEREAVLIFSLERSAAWVMEGEPAAFLQAVLWARPTLLVAGTADLRRLARVLAGRGVRRRSRLKAVVRAGEGGAEFERVADSLRSLGLRCLPD